ncbi:MAG: hypothetical protein N4A40_12795 [Tissierellales bacterium]|jgi:hypothetical protein|nr:hypothetical protein [Tissierellales bacterium]
MNYSYIPSQGAITTAIFILSCITFILFCYLIDKQLIGFVLFIMALFIFPYIGFVFFMPPGFLF